MVSESFDDYWNWWKDTDNVTKTSKILCANNSYITQLSCDEKKEKRKLNKLRIGQGPLWFLLNQEYSYS